MDIKSQTPLALTLDQIVADPKLQPRRDGIDPEHVWNLAQVPELWPPLIVAKRDNKNFLLDGFHRLTVATERGFKTVPVIVLDVPKDEDLLALAFSLNASHGRPLTVADRKAEAERWLKIHPDTSNREVSRRCGLAQGTVANIRKSLETGSIIPEENTRTGRDGRAYSIPPKHPHKTTSLLTVIENIVEAINPNEQRSIARYLQRLADCLEEQDKLKGFKTFDDAAKACRSFLGEDRAKELAERLGWSSNNILQIAMTLGYRAEDQS